MIACGCLGFGNLLPGLGCFRFITIFTTQNFYISLFLSTDHDSPSRRPFSGGPGSDTGRPDRPRLYPARCYSLHFPSGPPGLLVSLGSNFKTNFCPPVPLVSLGSPLLPSGPSSVSLDPPACPPVPLVPRGSYSSVFAV